ncbi:fibrous sheath CABYR-binding protein isoform X3 [Suricata suricatta]|uniref:Fibrous sheath CABYR binding protein n=1 Tax=Suricata suricatta TaxID=37032 RepID=A0A673TIH9_SURSU|nr:fibrous sheath CABYR-binding protein isoform X3 [Suricata suricatta]
MEESDEPDQPISAGRQEIRKRRRPSQPMVDKCHQTEVTEKKKHLPISQSSGPKATLSIGNISGSKVNCESLRISSQLQQTWAKRKRVHDMTDKSLQTDTTVEEKKEEIKSVGETVVPEEMPAAVGEVVSEFPESVQEVKIPSSGHSVQLKVDRSQQTSCTGDWTMMNIPQKETVDKEQQTYFSESEIVVFGRPDSPFSKSNEVVQKRHSSGKIFISEYPKWQPSTSRDEGIRQEDIIRSSFSQQSKKGSLGPLEDEQYIPVEVQPLISEEVSAEVQPTLAEDIPAGKPTSEFQHPQTEETPTEKGPAKVQPTLGEEALSERPPAEVQSPNIEKSPVQPFPEEETPEDEAPAKVESILAEEAFSEEPLSTEEPSIQEATELQLPPALEALIEEAGAEVQSPPAEAPGEVQSQSAKEAPAEEAPAEVQSPPPEEAPEKQAPGEVQSPPAEAPGEVQSPPAEALVEVQPPPAEEVPAEEAPGEVQSPPAEASPEGQSPPAEAPGEVQSPPAEAQAEVQSPPAEAQAEVQSPPAEAQAEVQSSPAEAQAEVQSPPAEATTAEEISAEVQSLPTEEASAEKASAEIWSLLSKEGPAEEAPAEFGSPPTEEASAEEASDEVLSLLGMDTPAEEASVNLWPQLVAKEAPAEEAYEETSAEVQSSPDVKAPEEKTPAEFWSPSAEDTTLEMLSVDKHFPAPKEDFITQISIENVLTQPSEQPAADKSLVDHVSTEHQYLQTEVPVVKLESKVLEDHQKPK